MKRPKSNIGQSVWHRLNNTAKAKRLQTNFVFNRYLCERLLYRLSQSPHANRFILKGGALLLVWFGENYRVTRDIDFLCRESIGVAAMEDIFRTLCDMDTANEDGLEFLADTVKGEEIREGANYPGVRVRLRARITGKNTTDTLQIDIGFGDAVTPDPPTITYPSLLDAPTADISVYPMETVIAEKLEAIVALDIANTRLKDFYDIWRLSHQYEFDGKQLKAAIANTFKRRKTNLPAGRPAAFTEAYYGGKEQQWKSFVKRSRVTLADGVAFEALVEDIAGFLLPVLDALREGRPFASHWHANEHTWQ